MGIVTAEDVSEEILGEIVDEDEEEAVPPVRRVAEGQYLINGAASVERVIEDLGLQVDPSELEGIDTFGGLILKVLARQPQVGDEVILAGFVFEVEAADGFRIIRLSAQAMYAEAAGETAALSTTSNSEHLEMEREPDGES